MPKALFGFEDRFTGAHVFMGEWDPSVIIVRDLVFKTQSQVFEIS